MQSGDFKFINNDSVIAKLVNKELKDVIIPEGVTEIAACAFSDENIETIYFPSSLKIINDSAFYGCKNLKTITFHPECKLNTICDISFANCSELTIVTLPEHVEKIGLYAFSNCKKLAEIFIPVDVIKMSANVFKGCNKNLIIKLEKTKIPTTFNSNWNVDNHKVIFLLKDIVIKPFSKSSVAKQRSGISDTTTTSKPTPINKNTTAKAQVTTTKVVVNKPIVTNKPKVTIEQPKKDELEPFIVGNYFLGGKELLGVKKEYKDTIKELIIPKSVVSIGSEAFQSTFYLTKVVGHENLKTISNNAFSGCPNLQEVKLHKNTGLLKGAFRNCYKLNAMTLYDQYVEEGLFEYSGLSSVTFESSVNFIQRKAFYACKLENLYLPDNISCIGDSSFALNKSLKTVRFSKNLQTIPSHAFYQCGNLTEIILPDNITEIGACAFYGCEKLKTVVFNKKLIRIDASAFYLNHSLEIVRIPKSVKFVGKKTFRGANLKEIIIEKDYGAPNVVPSGFEHGWYESIKNPVKITFVNV